MYYLKDSFCMVTMQNFKWLPFSWNHMQTCVLLFVIMHIPPSSQRHLYSYKLHKKTSVLQFNILLDIVWVHLGMCFDCVKLFGSKCLRLKFTLVGHFVNLSEISFCAYIHLMGFREILSDMHLKAWTFNMYWKRFRSLFHDKLYKLFNLLFKCLVKQDLAVEIHGFQHNMDAFEQMKIVRIPTYFFRGFWFISQKLTNCTACGCDWL